MKSKTILSVLWILTLTGLVFAQSENQFYGCGMGEMMYGNYGFGLMSFSWIFGILSLVVLILLIFWLIKQIQSPRRK